MPRASANGLELEYEVAGDAGNPALLLIMGLGAQMIVWPDEFVAALASRGFFVIRFDNRDVGRSSWLDDLGVPDVVSALATGDIPAPLYRMEDMADDAAGLLGALGLDKAHVVGASMGGMISQTFAIRHPEKTSSLVSIMSTTGNPGVGAPQPQVAETLFLAKAPGTREQAIEAGVIGSKMIASTGYAFDEEAARELAGRSYNRGYHPAGTLRQLLAILNQADRTSDLGTLTAATLVIHGDADVLVTPSGGKATAEAVPGADLWLVPGMGHDLPAELCTPIAERVAAHCQAA